MSKGSETSVFPYEATAALSALGAQLSRARRARGDTQEIAGERCGLHKQTVARIERGDPAVGVGKVFALLVTYGMSERLFGLAEPDEVTEMLYRKHLPSRGTPRQKAAS